MKHFFADFNLRILTLVLESRSYSQNPTLISDSWKRHIHALAATTNHGPDLMLRSWGEEKKTEEE